MASIGPGAQISTYVVEHELGRGGMGAVYLARDTRLDRRVALKVIAGNLSADPVFRARFERESRIAVALEHPNVVPVYDMGEADGTLFIAMRFLPGESLAERLRQLGRLPADAWRDLVRQLGAALDAAHSHGLVHRDVKPANVLLSNAHVYLTDFGLTRETSSESALTETGQWLGTIDFAAPEQIAGGRLDARTDTYAMACLAFHAWTGRVPFPGTAPAKIHGHLSGQIPLASSLRDSPEPLDAALARGMAKAPEDRFRSAGALASALCAATHGQAVADSERSVATGDALTGLMQLGAPTAASRRAPGPNAPRLPRPEGAMAARGRRSRTVSVAGALLAGICIAGLGALIALALTPSADNTSRPPDTVRSTPTRVETVTRAQPVPVVRPAPASGPQAGTTDSHVARDPARFSTGMDAGEQYPAAVCEVGAATLRCWTPNDGFTLLLGSSGRAVRDRSEEPANKGFDPGYRAAGYGSWARRGFRCESARSALTCRNRDGHGWTLPRYRGLPAYF